MVRKDFTICIDDVEIAIKKVRTFQVKKQGRKFRQIPGYGMGPKKKLTYKERMEKKIKKQINDAKKAGFKKNKKICVAIGKYLYYPSVVNILITGKIKIRYSYDDEEIYSLKMLKIMKENGKYLTQMIKERSVRRKNMRFKLYY